jgi:hypothetical protein
VVVSGYDTGEQVLPVKLFVSIARTWKIIARKLLPDQSPYLTPELHGPQSDAQVK